MKGWVACHLILTMPFSQSHVNCRRFVLRSYMCSLPSNPAVAICLGLGAHVSSGHCVTLQIFITHDEWENAAASTLSEWGERTLTIFPVLRCSSMVDPSTHPDTARVLSSLTASVLTESR